MKVYLVGGAVRDELLGREVIEHDWVVVGATPEQMLALGYTQVGKDFPVFLHPKTKDEYALARMERKSGVGYQGFACEYSPDVSLIDDLIRRDLTINAMAKDDDGQIIDLHNGLQDLKDKVLRHVSDAFVEDPLRVLRIARFAARYHHLGFTIAPETLKLMSHIIEQGELAHLSAERVWKETQRALGEQHPHIYFEVLKSCGGLKDWFPEIAALWGVPNPPQHHPEIDSGVHTMMVLEQAALLSKEPVIRYAALLHDLGKAVTDPEKWPSHHGHEKAGLPLVKKLSKRICAPNNYQRLALLASEYHLHIHRIFELNPTTIMKLFKATRALKSDGLVKNLLLACEADARGRTGFEHIEYPQRQYVLDAIKAVNEVDVQAVIADGYEGAAISQEHYERQVARLKAFKQARAG
jgi:tRNA nucleotidyltransferase (CCA-adding enzyme)